jgi:hypothetical protein
MRTTLIGVLVTALLGVATPAAAEEITMICKYKDETVTLKYVAPFIGKKKVLQRVEGDWVQWVRPTEYDYKPPQLTVTKGGAVLNTIRKYKAETDYLASNLLIHKKGDEFFERRRYVLDFEFPAKKENRSRTKLDGTLFTQPDIYVWDCKKYEPNKNKS